MNILVKNEHVLEDDIKLFAGEEVIELDPSKDMFDILVLMGLFPSKSQARKIWKKQQQIPSGWSVFERLGKKREDLFIWNPTKFSDTTN